MWFNECWSGWTSGMMGRGGLSIMHIFGPLLLIVFLMFLIWLGRREKSCLTDHPDSPLDILKRRYAEGEISKEKFNQIKKDLEA